MSIKWADESSRSLDIVAVVNHVIKSLRIHVIDVIKDSLEYFCAAIPTDFDKGLLLYRILQ